MRVVRGDSGYIHIKGSFPRHAPRITWGEIIKCIDRSYQGDNAYYMGAENGTAPYFQLSKIEPFGTIKSAYDEVSAREERLDDLDIYVALSVKSASNGRHEDDHDVLIVQSIGSTIYKFDDGYEAVMTPGDSLFVPAFVYHEPIALTPRVNLSFGLEMPS